MNKEIWKPVVGWECLYEVSNHGRVRRVGPAQGAVVGRIMRPYLSRQGYWIAVLTAPHLGERKIRVHRAMAFAFLGPPGTRTEVNHKNGIKSDNSLSNLEWVTRSENLTHSFRVLGRCVSWTKLNAWQVRIIRRCARLKIAYGYQAALARDWNVSSSAISAASLREKRVYVNADCRAEQ